MFKSKISMNKTTHILDYLQIINKWKQLTSITEFRTKYNLIKARTMLSKSNKHYGKAKAQDSGN